jgi:hypothetical protein
MAQAHGSGVKPIVAYDADIKDRGRIGRAAFALVSTVTVLSVPSMVGYNLGDTFLDPTLGLAIGFAGGGFLLSKIAHLYIIHVRALSGFMTINNLGTLFGLGKSYVKYGTGTHVCYPWESRDENNNASLEEVSESFTATVQCLTGVVTVKGSVRLRASLPLLDIYLGGVAAVVGDLSDLIVTKIASRLSSKNVADAISDIEGINNDLAEKFDNGSEMTKFEKRFGVDVGDITVAEILGSAEAQKTRNAIDEAVNIFTAMEKLGGYEPGKLREAIDSGKVTPVKEEALRKQAMAVSENAKMDLTTNEHIITINAPPELVEAFKFLGPGLAPALNALANTRKGK